MIRRIIPIVLGVIVLSLVSVSVLLHAQSEPDHLKVIISPTQLGTANTRIAEVEGYFAAQNIEVEYVPMPVTTDAEAVSLLITGEVDVLQASWSPGIFNAITRGAQLKVVAAPTYNDPEYCPYGAFVVRAEDAENFDIESLRGAHVAIALGGATYYFDRWLTSHGMSMNDTIIENIPTGSRAEALAAGTVDLAYMVEPTLSRSIAGLGFEIVVDYDEIIPDGSASVLIYGPNMLGREDDLPVRFLTAYLQGSRQFNEGPTERNLEILSPALEIEPELLEQICWIRFRENGLLNTDTALDYMNWLNEQGQLDETLEVEQFYDPSYAEQAYERLAAMSAPEATEAAE